MNSIIDIAFSDTVKAIQERRGPRENYAKMAARGGWTNLLGEDVVDFVRKQNSIYLGTTGANGQPYIQHRGGPPGFLHVLDERTIAFADFRGNRQFISQGNLADNSKAFLFLMDYANTTRLKIWGEARVVEDDAELVESLMPKDYRAKAEQAIVFTVNLLDFNCRAHIPRLVSAQDAAASIAARDQEIARLEATVEALGGNNNL